MIVYVERCRKLNNFGEPEGEYDIVRVNDFWYENIAEDLKGLADYIFQRFIIPKWFIKDNSTCAKGDEQIGGLGRWNYSGYRGRRSFIGNIHLRYYAFVAWENESEDEVNEFLSKLYQGEFWQKQGIDKDKIFPILWAASATVHRCVSPRSQLLRSADICVPIRLSPGGNFVETLGFSSIVRHLTFGLS